MKAILQYQADDGSIFKTQAEAERHDRLCADVAEIMLEMGPKPDVGGCAFENGMLGYIHHDVETIDRVANRLLELARQIAPVFARMLVWKNGVHPSHPSRAMSEMPSPLSRAWYRIDCTDEQGREFGQIYYRNHPDQCETTCYLDRRSGGGLKPVDGVIVLSFGRGL